MKSATMRGSISDSSVAGGKVAQRVLVQVRPVLLARLLAEAAPPGALVAVDPLQRVVAQRDPLERGELAARNLRAAGALALPGLGEGGERLCVLAPAVAERDDVRAIAPAPAVAALRVPAEDPGSVRLLELRGHQAALLAVVVVVGPANCQRNGRSRASAVKRPSWRRA
jgi:hypothetical protein